MLSTFDWSDDSFNVIASLFVFWTVAAPFEFGIFIFSQFVLHCALMNALLIKWSTCLDCIIGLLAGGAVFLQHDLQGTAGPLSIVDSLYSI